MSEHVLTFPPNETFNSALRENPRRRAYVRGLAILDDYANDRDEARVGRTLFEQGIYDFTPFQDAATAAGSLGDSLFDGANLGDRLKLRGHGDLLMNAIVLNGHLKVSLRERLIDLFYTSADNRSIAAYSQGRLEAEALSRDANRMFEAGFPNHLVADSLGVVERDLETALRIEPAPTALSVDFPRYDRSSRLAYAHTNSRGVTYFLHATEVPLRGGRPQTIYFFAKVEYNEAGVPVALPEDRVVKENPRNGFLTISKKRL